MDRGFRAGVFLFVLLGTQIGSRSHGQGLQFIENKGQWDEAIDYQADVPGGTMAINSAGFHYLLHGERKIEELHSHLHQANEEGVPTVTDDQINNYYIRMQWIGANRVQPKGSGKSTTYHNYFLGNDNSRWASYAYAYDMILYEDVYEGVDLRTYSQGTNFKYDFVVEPGYNPDVIVGRYEGADRYELDQNGSLYIHTELGDLIEKRPFAYQTINGKRMPVECNYTWTGNTLGFEFPEGYDACEVLVIDPILIFSTYSGSTADNWGSTATPGENGKLYSAGVTNQSSFDGKFPATTGAFQTQYGGVYDIGILKYDSLGKQLLYASHLGGGGSESPHSLVMDEDGSLLILGTTSSTNFPTSSNAFDRTFNGGAEVSNVITYQGSDIIVTRISSDGATLLASTYFGGSQNDGLNPPDGLLTLNYGDELRGDIITNDQGDIYVTTVTSSTDLPELGSFSPTYKGGGTDALILKWSPDLSQVKWGVLLGGSNEDTSHTIKLDEDGNLYVAGGTASEDFPMAGNSFKPTLGGVADGWIAKLKSDGTALLQSTFVGTESIEQVYFIDLNLAGDVFVYGQTNAGLSFPVTPDTYANPGSGQFLQKYSSDLSTLLVSTVFGSGGAEPNISPTAFLVNECDNIYMTGWGGALNSATSDSHWNTSTLSMPVTFDAYQKFTSGNDFYFMVLTGDARKLVYATYLGGPSSLTHVDGGTSRFDKHGIVYHAVCAGCASGNQTGESTSDFPTTPGVWSRTNNSENCNNAAFKFDLSSLQAGLNAPVNVACVGDTVEFENSSIGGELFHWDFGDGFKIVTPNPEDVKHVYLEKGTYTIWLKVVDEGTCKSVDSLKTTLNIGEHVATVRDDDAICGGQSIQLSATGGVSYDWYTKGREYESTEQNPVVTPEESTAYFVSVYEPFGCTWKDTVNIRVVPRVEPMFSYLFDDYCSGGIPELQLANQTEADDDITFVFDLGDGSTSEEREVNHTYEQSGLYKVTLKASREFCEFTGEEQIPVLNVKVPNVFTPGGSEGYNDTFVVQVDEALAFGSWEMGVPCQLKVYNRWGELVYESTDYRNDWSASAVAAGVYYYELTLAGSTCRSWVHVIK